MASRTIEQLNKPQAVDVETDANGAPILVRLHPIQIEGSGGNRRSNRQQVRQRFRSVRSDGQWMKVIAIEGIWKINDEWWRGEKLEIERLYFDVVLENSQRLTVFHDLVRDIWLRQAE